MKAEEAVEDKAKPKSKPLVDNPWCGYCGSLGYAGPTRHAKRDCPKCEVWCCDGCYVYSKYDNCVECEREKLDCLKEKLSQDVQ